MGRDLFPFFDHQMQVSIQISSILRLVSILVSLVRVLLNCCQFLSTQVCAPRRVCVFIEFSSPLPRGAVRLLDLVNPSYILQGTWGGVGYRYRIDSSFFLDKL